MCTFDPLVLEEAREGLKTDWADNCSSAGRAWQVEVVRWGAWRCQFLQAAVPAAAEVNVHGMCSFCSCCSAYLPADLVADLPADPASPPASALCPLQRGGAGRGVVQCEAAGAAGPLRHEARLPQQHRCGLRRL